MRTIKVETFNALMEALADEFAKGKVFQAEIHSEGGETLEWNGDRGMEYTAPIVCPACNEPEHTADCPLDALLAYPLGDTTP